MPHKIRSKIVDDIEHKTGRRVAIDTVETEDSLAKCHPQDQSPLFTQLPRELRDLIWAFATAPTEDEENKYKETEYYCRPGHTARLKTDYSLLLTCRRAWLEAHAFPMLQAEQSFWYDRGAPDGRTKEWMANLTDLNRKHFGTLFLYVQMYRIEGLKASEGRLRDYFLPSATKTEEDFQPRIFHVTIRHTDWWYWENEAPLKLDYQWFQAMLDTPDLRRTAILRLELETLDYKVPQLNPILEQISRMESQELETHDVNGKAARTKFVLAGEPKISSWSGPTNIHGESFSPYQGKERLNYHVATLTWRLQFPQYPKAHIPDLRLASRAKPPRSSSSSSGLALLDSHDNSHMLDNNLVSDAEIRNAPYPPSGGYLHAASPIRDWSRVHRMIQRRRRRGLTSLEDTPESMLDSEEMRQAARGVHERDYWQAHVTEWVRRRRFWELMRPQWDEIWARRFAEQSFLLRLEEL